MNDISTTSRIIHQCMIENTTPLGVDYSSGGCTFSITPDDIKNYFMEYNTGSFSKIIW